MKHFMYILLACLSLSLTACQKKAPPKPAHLRFLSMIQFTSAKLTIRGKGKNKEVQKTLPLNYGQPTDYQQLSPGYYKIMLSVKGKTLLKSTYVMGKNGYYTLLATGLLPEKWTVNPKTTLYHLKHIFAGEELESTNNNLPQWLMMRDNYDGSKKSVYIRLVNANPLTPILRIKKDGASLKSGLAYPSKSDLLKLKAGSHSLQFYFGDVQLMQKTIHTTAGYIYTAVIGNKQNATDRLAVSILQNPSRVLMQSK